MGHAAKENVEILGLVTVAAKGRKLTEKETKRLEAAKKCLRKLRGLPFARKQKLDLARCFGVSKASYGWMGITPPQAQMTKTTSEVWRTG